MKQYQIVYFLVGMAIYLGNHYFFVEQVFNKANPEGIFDDIVVWGFALFLGFVMSWSMTQHYKKKEKLKAKA